MASYKIANIAIEVKEDGSKIFWVTYAGWHPGQGGMDFGEGSYGFPTLEGALEFYKMKYEKSEEEILRIIKEKK